MSDVDKFMSFISDNKDEEIILLKQIEVVMWLFGDLSFLPKIEEKNKTADKKKLKDLEDAWGRAVMKARRPDLKLNKQWTNLFGEYICEEIRILQHQLPKRPAKIENYIPDIETPDFIIEAKTNTYNTSGTAGEKILGCPFKYADIPRLYRKPLKIFCIGGAEKLCREQYGNLIGEKCTEQKRKFLEFYESNGISYMSATDLLRQLT